MARAGYPYIKVGVGDTRAGIGTANIRGVLYCSMKEATQTFDARPCPDCGEMTGLVHLGNESPREICGRFGCEWDGITLRKAEPVRVNTAEGVVVE